MFFPHGVILSTAFCGYQASLCNDIGGGSAASAWPSNNRAYYLPFWLDSTVTVYQIAIEVTTQSGNCDVGIYDEAGNRLVSAGSTAVGAAGIQLFNITDTVLSPDVYFMAMNCSTTAAAFTATLNTANVLRTYGVQMQDVGATALPDPATFAAMTNSYLPSVALATKSTI